MRKFLTLVSLAAVAAGGVAAQTASAGGGYGTGSRAKLQIHSGKLGRFIVDQKGLTLYLFEKDKGGKSSCYGACAKVWAPFVSSGKANAGNDVSASKIGTTTRKGGARQVTYAGHPLYYYDDDHKAGQTKGQGLDQFGAEWYVVAPSGKKIDKD